MAPLRALATGLLGLFALPLSSSAAPASFNNADTTISALIGHAQNASNTDLYFHMDAPSAAGWGAIAIGSQMEDALFFIMYPNMAGNGATVSVRTAPGHVMPKPIAGFSAHVTNSTNTNGRMTADFVCYSCTQWGSQKLDTTSSSTQWLFAMGPGKAINSNDNAAPISMHAYEGMFEANMQSAGMAAPPAGQASPLLATTNAATSSTTVTPLTAYKYDPTLIVAHAVLLSLAFYFFMPVGVIMLRLPPMQRTPAAVPLHYTSQGIAWVLSIAGMGIAIYFSQHLSLALFHDFKSYHQAIGLTATSATIVQGFLGLAHHLLFRKMGKRSPITYLHFFLGWCIIPLGLLNAPIGLALLKNEPAMKGMIAATVIIFVITVAVSVWGWTYMIQKKKAQPTHAEKQVSDSETRGSDEGNLTKNSSLVRDS